MQLTQESLTAIEKRRHQEHAARIRANYRYELEQHEVADRKQRNRLMLAIVAIACIGLFIGQDFASRSVAETGARPGQVIAKSDLHVEPVKPEKRHDNAKIRSSSH